MPAAKLQVERLGSLVSGSRTLVVLMEGYMVPPRRCRKPGSAIPTTLRLRQAGRRILHLPMAQGGNALITVGSEPQSLPPFLVAPKGPPATAVDFWPPTFPLRRTFLYPHGEDAAAWFARPPLEPSLSVSLPPVCPPFAQKPLCDWVPVKSGLAAVGIPLAVRDMDRKLVSPAPDHTVPLAPVEDGRLVRVSLKDLARPPSDHALGIQRLFPLPLDGMAPLGCALRPKANLDPRFPVLGHSLPPPGFRTISGFRREPEEAVADVLGRVVRSWKRLPALVRLPGMAAAMAVAMAVLAPISRSDAAGQEPVGLRAVVASQWASVQRNILDRAAIALTDDFRNGLSDWEGRGEWAKSWSYDASGFVRVGTLALYTPSMPLSDYRTEFLGQIEKRSLGWVVRARDLDNYYAIKLTVTSSGPLPTVVIQRSAVLGGVPGPVIEKAFPVQVHTDTLYRVLTEVRGPDFMLSVQGQVVDSWSEPRLKAGGIGFFNGKGELARLRWVGVWHQYDTLGRLCALLAPAGLPGRNDEE